MKDHLLVILVLEEQDLLVPQVQLVQLVKEDLLVLPVRQDLLDQKEQKENQEPPDHKVRPETASQQ
jgi:hypothetical protein